MALWKDFKTFAFKGSVLDLAVAVVIGAAFTKVVTTVVDALIMPLVDRVLPGGDWLEWSPGGIKVGQLIGVAIEFVIIAFVVFALVSLLRRASGKRAAEQAPTEVTLLTEIRDTLRAGERAPSA